MEAGEAGEIALNRVGQWEAEDGRSTKGRQKEEEFMKKTQEMVQVEEKLRIPIAQGLPWTTDEPEVSPLRI
ncbi:hypothetical protein Pint_19093 [Pistacia integerrima]|uniref:Uncharacterized protein n=1 Tax=Pistacia integerrima TaxID=434235 RepID=A0ACC0YYI1_9ROSI|nr:hypothetical protein Pint_19093 [Pistacia integerrima]